MLTSAPAFFTSARYLLAVISLILTYLPGVFVVLIPAVV